MGVAEARLLQLDTYVVLDTPGRNDYEVLEPKAILDCGGLCLVQKTDDGE